MRKLAFLSLLAIANVALAAVDVDKDIWFSADFDSAVRLNNQAYFQKLTPEGFTAGKFGKGYYFFRETNNRLPPMAKFFADEKNFPGDSVERRGNAIFFKGGQFHTAFFPTGISYHWACSESADTWSVYVTGKKGTKITLWAELGPISEKDLNAIRKNEKMNYDDASAVEDFAVTNSFSLTGGWQRVSCYVKTDNRTAPKRKIALHVKSTGPVEMKQFQLQETGNYPYKSRLDPGIWIDGGQSMASHPVACSDSALLASFPYQAGSFAFWVKNAPGVPRRVPVGAWSFAKDWATQWGLGPSAFYTGGEKYHCNVWNDVPRSSEWTHVAGVWDKDRIAVYIDGELVGQRIQGREADRQVCLRPLKDNVGTFQVGAFGNASGSTDAVIDEFAIFNRVLTEQEIWELASAKKGLFEGRKNVLAEEPWIRTFFRNEERAALRCKVWSSEPGDYKMHASVAGHKLPDQKVSLVSGEDTLAIPFQVALLRPGSYPYSFQLVDGNNKTFVSQSGELTVRGRLEKDEYLFHSWGGMEYVHHDFGDIVGINCYNVDIGNKQEIRRIVEHGAHPNLRYWNGDAWYKQDFDWRKIRERTKKAFEDFVPLHSWVSTLLNTEIYGSGVALRAKDNPKYREMARKDLGMEPDFTYGTAPSEVSWGRLRKAPLRGVIGHDECPTLETLNWVMEKGMPLYRSNRETVEAIHEIKPGMVVWSEPLGDGVADSVDMGADWLYQYSTATTLWQLRSQYACCRRTGKPYMPTLCATYCPTISGAHPVLKDEKGKPLSVGMGQSADEVIIKTWISIGAVPTRNLSIFSLNSWERGVANARKFDASSSSPVDSIAEPDAATRYGKAWREELAPAAELLRDMPNARSDVAFLLLPEIEHAGSFWWGHYHYSVALREALASQAPAFDILGGNEAKSDVLSKYKYVILPMARVIYDNHAEELEKAAKLGTIVVQDSYATNHYPNEVFLKELKYNVNRAGKTKKAFVSWYTNHVDELLAIAPAHSSCDGVSGYTFMKEHKGARYVVVVNNARDAKPSYLNQFLTNAWYRVAGASQKITTTIREIPPDSKIYLFNARGRDDSLSAEYGPAEGRVYCIYPRPLKAPELELAENVKRGSTTILNVRINDESGKPALGRQIVELKLADEKGVERDESGRYVVEDGIVRIPLRIAENETLAGSSPKWEVRVTDLTTGKSGVRRFSVQ